MQEDQPIVAVNVTSPLIATLAYLGIITLILLVGLLLYLVFICAKYKLHRSRLSSNSSGRTLDRISTRSQACQTPPPVPKPPGFKLMPSLSPSTSFDSTKAVVNETAIRDCSNQFRPISSPKMNSFKNINEPKSSPPNSPQIRPITIGRAGVGRSRGQNRGPSGSEDNPIMFRQRVAQGHGRGPLS
jgi:hypothetical protein